MRPYSKNRALCFDDILLTPQEGRVQSRGEVDLSMTLGGDHRPEALIRLRTPVIAAPMDTVCDEEMVEALDNLGALGVMHRYMSREDIISKTASLRKKRINNVAVSVSTKDVYDKQYIHALDHAGANIFCIDTANGHSALTIEATQELRSKVFDSTHIMVGNVSTVEGFSALIEAGADSVRVGIGGGSACSTRIVSGHGAPLLWSIQQCVGVANLNRTAVIADGGIRNTGDMVKAFAAGAGAVMVGSLLAGHDESPRKYDEEGNIIYRGMASGEAQIDWRGSFDSEEGVSGRVPARGPVEKTLKEFRYGIASGCSYSGVLSLWDLHKQARYIEVSDLTANESKPRI
jgi:IMP dehydrogenase